MELAVYEYDSLNNVYNKISKDGLQTRPVQTSHDGTNGEVIEKKLFLRNDDAGFYYTGIELTPYPARKVRVGDIQYPEAFVGFKIIAGDTQPSSNQWLAISSGSVIAFDDVGDTNVGDTSYKPFWVQIDIPSGTRAQTINDIAINVQTDENPVGV